MKVHLDGGPDRTLCGIRGLERWRQSGVRRSDVVIVVDLADGVSCARCVKSATMPQPTFCVVCHAPRPRFPKDGPIVCGQECAARCLNWLLRASDGGADRRLRGLRDQFRDVRRAQEDPR